ncbi:mannosyltransferase [Spirochaetia bacterium]|nr:mannosyltransferase [Spirochaetia bacterium]
MIKMRLVYDDIIYSIQRSGGISIYWSELEKYLNPDKILLYDNYKKNIFFKLNDKNDTILKKNIFTRFTNVRLKEDDKFIFHSSYYRYCKNRNALNIITVFDFIYEYYRFDKKAIVHKLQKKNAIHNTDGIICISESTKNDLLRLYPEFNGLIKVVYLGFPQEYCNLNIDKKDIVVFVGGRSGYKNFNYAVQIMKKLPDLQLLIIGGGDLKKEEIAILNDLIPNRYEFYLNLSNGELNIKYNEAKFLLYPSLYEGFGIPVVEAQAAGCPVICCKTSSLPEVGGSAVLYISGKDINEDIQIISQINNQSFYNRIVEEGLNNCKRFSWKKCAEQTADFYKELWDKK